MELGTLIAPTQRRQSGRWETADNGELNKYYVWKLGTSESQIDV